MAYRRIRAEVYKIVHVLYDHGVALDIGLDKSGKHELRGHKYKLEKTRAKTNIRKNMFASRVVNIWNSLSTDVVDAPSLNTFKSRLYKYWEMLDFHKSDPEGTATVYKK